MKRFLLCLMSLVVLSFANAVNYCAPQSWGYAGSVTGGGDATPTLVKSVDELTAAIGGKKPKDKVVIITKSLTFTSMFTMQDAQNITIMALPGVKLISNQQEKTTSGILFIKRSSNILLRNLTFEGPGAYDCDGNDNLCFEKVTNAWVDHCDFQDGCDGNFDIKSESDDLTVTWCRFRYLKEPKAGGSGGADDHRFTNLVGSSSSDKPADGTYNITYGFCWWDEGCKQRMTRCRNALIHYLNCYWNSSVSDYYVGPENVSSYFEGCTFAGLANTNGRIWYPFNKTVNYCKFVNCTGNLPENSGSVDAPSYAYDQLTASKAKSLVTNSTCGAGATLTVTEAAAVSSSCDGEGPVDPQPGVISDWWNISDDDFNSLGTITSETVVRDLHIVATSDKAVTIEANAQTVDTLQFTHRLKLNGTGNANYRHLWFDVTGTCSVKIYLMSAKNTEDRTLNIATGSFGNIVTTLSAGGTLAAQTYSYTGEATRIYLYSANSGINIYGIQLSYPTPTPTGMEAVTGYGLPVTGQKIIREGRLLILREGKTYSATGAEVR